MLGNGWEWTATEFAPFPGFEPFPFYRGYSADFFDGKHFVMKGGSARTAVCMLRPTFPQLVSGALPIYLHGISLRVVVESRGSFDNGLFTQSTTSPIYEFAADVRAGLTKRGQKELLSKYLYDDVGSSLV